MTIKTIHEYPEETTPVVTDEIVMWKAASSVTRRATRRNFVGATLTGLGTIDTGGFTFTIPATGIAALRGDLNVIFVPLVVGGTAAGNLAILQDAEADAAALGTPTVLQLPAGLYNINNWTLTNDDILVKGAFMSRYNPGGNTLTGGTILSGGTIDFGGGRGLGLMNLGIQVSGKNAITGGTADDCLILNVAVRGGGTMHGCVFTSGANNRALNFFAAKTEHGLVFKAENNQAAFIDCWETSISSVTLKSDAGVDCYGNQIANVKSNGGTLGAAGGIWLHALASNNVYGNVISGLNFRNVSYGIYATAHLAGGYLCQANRIGDGIIHTPQYGGVQLGSSGDVAGNGPDYNDFSDLTVIGAGAYGFTNQYGGAHNALYGCRALNPTIGTIFGGWQNYGAGLYNNIGVVLRLTKTGTTAVSTGTGAWVDVPWEAENDDHAMHVANSAAFGPPPVGGATYRIRAAIVFAAHATGIRAVRIARSVSGGAYAGVGPEQIVSPGSATADCQVMLEYVTTFNGSYEFKVQVMQTSGGSLNVQTTSHLTVELTR